VWWRRTPSHPPEVLRLWGWAPSSPSLADAMEEEMGPLLSFLR
jgi:hypothetical protein